MQAHEFKSFQEFWPYYLGEHRLKSTRALHYFGSTVGLGAILMSILSGNAWWLLYGILVGYLCAWIGHFYFEHNKPATFKHPLWSFLADYKMFYMAVTGQLQQQLSEHLGSGAKPQTMD